MEQLRLAPSLEAGIGMYSSDHERCRRPRKKIPRFGPRLLSPLLKGILCIIRSYAPSLSLLESHTALSGTHTVGSGVVPGAVGATPSDAKH